MTCRSTAQCWHQVPVTAHTTYDFINACLREVSPRLLLPWDIKNGGVKGPCSPPRPHALASNMARGRTKDTRRTARDQVARAAGGRDRAAGRRRQGSLKSGHGGVLRLLVSAGGRRMYNAAPHVLSARPRPCALYSHRCGPSSYPTWFPLAPSGSCPPEHNIISLTRRRQLGLLAQRRKPTIHFSAQCRSARARPDRRGALPHGRDGVALPARPEPGCSIR